MNKKIFLLLIASMFLLGFACITKAQDAPPATSFETSFGEGQPTGTWYSWAGAFTITYEGGEMIVAYNKEEANAWDRLVQWVGPFNLSQNPYYSIRVKSDTDRQVHLDFKDANDVVVRKTINLADDNQYQVYFINLTDDKGDIDLTQLNEIQFDVGGYGIMSGTIVFDEVKLGDAAAPNLQPPTLNAIDDMLVLPDAGEQIVVLTGISDGDGMSEPIEISASTDNEELITGLSVEYTSPDSTGILRFSIIEGASGQATIYVTLNDEGEVENTATYSFQVMVVKDGGTGFTYSFTEPGLPLGLQSTPQFNTSLRDDETLRVGISKNNRWSGFLWELGGVYDMSENPYVNLNIRSGKDQILQLFLVDIFGNGYEAVIVETQFIFHELVDGKNEFRQNRIYSGNDFVTVSYDFSGANPDIVDLSKIAGIMFVSNGTALTYNGEYFIDEIRLGDHALRKAYVGQIPDHHFYVNAEGKHSILIPEIKHATSLELTGGDGLMENIDIHDIVYQPFVENNREVMYGNSRIEFDLAADATGTSSMTLTAVAAEGYVNHVVSFMLTIAGNYPPTIDEIDDMVVQTGIEQEIRLSGISDGDRDVEQQVTIAASSSDPDIVAETNVSYQSPSPYGSIAFTALTPGEAMITVTATDEDGASTDVVFSVMAYASLNNPPAIDPVENTSLINSDGAQSIYLTGIHDGDDGDQQLSITANSSDPGIIPHPTIIFEQGNQQAELILEPLPGVSGEVTITVTVEDDGATAENDGDKSASITFEVRSMDAPITGYTYDLSDPGILQLFKPEGLGTSFFLEVVDTLGAKALRITMKDKWTFGGMWVDIPAILDLTEHPIISYEILSLEQETWHWNYFYDAHGTDAAVNRNIENSDVRQFPVPPNEWTTVTFDYRYPGDMNNSQGNAIDASMIRAVLFNLHDIKPRWPFTDYSGVVYYRNISIGDQAVFGPMTRNTTIDQAAEQGVYIEDGVQHVMLTGISNGDGSIEGVSISTNSTQPHIVPAPVISSIQPDGTALLTYDPQQTGTTNLRLTVEAEGAEPTQMNFLVRVLQKGEEGVATVQIDRSEKRQTIHGLGTFENNRRWVDLYANQLGASAVRIGIISNQWEPVNDNNDPHVINMAGFNYDAFDFDYFRELKENGVETFILTSWSPPAWMKRNLSLDHREQAVQWELTDNILEPYYYEEFAESMAALVRAFKEEAGIDIKAIGLQNEPFFNEPYASAILSGPRFAELIEVVGNRFAKEGLHEVGFFMPEQVFGLGWGDYSNEGYLAAVRANPAADAYTNYFAVHGYDGSGIAAGFPTYGRWSDLFSLAQQGDNPKEVWMTETHIGYQGWNSAMQLAGALHGSLWAGNISLWTNWSFGDMQLSSNVPNSSFYTSMNYFKYIRPGAVRVETETDHPDVLATAFENTDGRFTIVLINKSSNAAISVKLDGDNLPPVFAGYRTSRYENFANTRVEAEPGKQFILPANSVTTLITEHIYMEKVADKTVLENSETETISIRQITNAAGTIDGLSLHVEHTNPELFSQFILSDINPDGTATIEFTPAPDQLGFSEVRLRLSDENNQVKNVVFYINVVADNSTDAPSQVISSVRIYPNPAKNQVTVDIGNDRYEHLAIIDLNGRTLASQTIHSPVTTINTGGLHQGIYFIQLSGKEGKTVKRLVIQ